MSVALLLQIIPVILDYGPRFLEFINELKETFGNDHQVTLEEIELWQAKLHAEGPLEPIPVDLGQDDGELDPGDFD